MRHIVMIVLCIVMAVAAALPSLYIKRECVVVEVHNQECTVEDSNGNLWIYTTDTPQAVGSVVILTMYNNRTATQYDDVIVDVKEVRVSAAAGTYRHIASLVGVSDANYPIVQPAQKTN